MAPELGLLVGPPGFAHLAGLPELVDPNEAPEAVDLVALRDALACVLVAERALAPPGSLEDERLALVDEARLDVPGGARLGVLEDACQGVPGGVRDDAREGACDDAHGVQTDVLEDARLPHQQSAAVDAQDAPRARGVAGTPGHDSLERFLVQRGVAVVVERYQVPVEWMSISCSPAEKAAPVVL
jgi:hypothetical protein